MIRKLNSIVALSLVAIAAQAGPYVPGSVFEPLLPVTIGDPGIEGWATGVLDFNFGPAGDTSFQIPANALGPAEGTSGGVTNLGRGVGGEGWITLSFDAPIIDGPGADFAVFENGFLVGPNQLFGELAWVEVSTDGLSFFRFPGFYSPNASPVGEFGTFDPTDFTGFAGKYEAGSGTPYDLALFSEAPLIDVNNINYVRITDIVGDGSVLDDTPAFVEVNGQMIPTGCPCPVYDPYAPTLQGPNGFDLDGVGVLHFGEVIDPPPPGPVPIPAGAQLLILGLFALVGARRGGLLTRIAGTATRPFAAFARPGSGPERRHHQAIS